MGRAPEGRRMVMSAGLGSLSLVNVFLTTGAMAVIGVLLLCALVLLVVNKRSKPLRIVCVVVIVLCADCRAGVPVWLQQSAADPLTVFPPEPAVFRPPHPGAGFLLPCRSRTCLLAGGQPPPVPARGQNSPPSAFSIESWERVWYNFPQTICKIGLCASSVPWMGSCHRNEKLVLRCGVRTRCNIQMSRFASRL